MHGRAPTPLSFLRRALDLLRRRLLPARARVSLLLRNGSRVDFVELGDDGGRLRSALEAPDPTPLSEPVMHFLVPADVLVTIAAELAHASDAAVVVLQHFAGSEVDRTQAAEAAKAIADRCHAVNQVLSICVSETPRPHSTLRASQGWQ